VIPNELLPSQSERNWARVWHYVFDEALDRDLEQVCLRLERRIRQLTRHHRREPSFQTTEDVALPQGAQGVAYRRAAAYLRVSERQIRNLVAQDKLTTVGDGQHKKITAESLRKYKGMPETAATAKPGT